MSLIGDGFLLQRGPMDFYIQIEAEMRRFIVHLGTRLLRSIRSEASNPGQLETLIAVVKFMEATWS